MSEIKIRRTRYISMAECRGCGRKRTSGLYVYQHSGVVLPKGSRFFMPESSVYASATTGSTMIDCAGCGNPQLAKEVRGRFNAAVPCNAKCTSAKGFSCECSCGGKNHGAGYANFRGTQLRFH